ncbi:MAG: methyltransferase [Ruminococcus sp.]|nr:methyltransferase [Oscillospiraceae bacterium]MDY4414046.1 methyltransferase [Ruminococcus sp.]
MTDYSMEKLTDNIFVCASSEHRFGTDAFLLTYFSNYRMKDKVCDLGTGCGIIPMIMQKKNPPQITYAVDIQESAIEQLKKGIEASNVKNIVPVLADLKILWDNAPKGQLDLVICNPPYKATNAGIESSITAQKIARHEIMCNIDDVCRSASKLLKFGGRLCMCNRPERLADVITAMKSNDIEPKRIRFVANNPEQSPWLFLIEGKKGSKPFLKIEPPLYMKSNELKEIYQIGKECE